MNSEKMVAEKIQFIYYLKKALRQDPRAEVEDIIYTPGFGKGDKIVKEIITIYFIGGTRKKINVTANNNNANYEEIGRAVYGDGAHGEILE